MKKKLHVTVFTLLISLGFAFFTACGGQTDDGKTDVTFHLSYPGAPAAPATAELIPGEMYGTLPSPTRTGYDFKGWYTSRAATAEQVTAESIVPEEDHTLYAKWTGKEIEVSFELMGGQTIWDEYEIPSETFTFGRSYGIKFPDDPVREDRAIFAGWYYDIGGTQGPVNSYSTVEKAEAHTLYAKWRPAKFSFDFETDEDLSGIVDSLGVGVTFSIVEDPENSENHMLKIDNANAMRYSSGWVFSAMFTDLNIQEGDTLSFDYMAVATEDNEGEFRFRALGPGASFLPGFTGGATAGAAPPTTEQSLATLQKKHVEIRMPVATDYFRIEWWSTYTYGSEINSAAKAPHCILLVDNILITPVSEN